ncbi:MAG: ABC transporter permease, partial [Erysipelotrichaceae bacterium]|nr:ABC transporter permease [Erysipelotrichaceae bacterium]
MLKYILQRIGMMLLTLFIIMTLLFFMIRLMPGSPFDDPELSPEFIEMMEKKHHLHDPIPLQYYYFLHDIIVDGYWGVSLKLEPMMPVWQVLTHRIPVTLQINIFSILIALPLGLIAGTLAALNKSRMPDHIISFLVVIFISVPSFVVASLLQYFLGFKTNAFKIIYDSTGTFWQRMHSLLLPIFALSFHPIATVCRYLRGELIDNISSEYLLLARTKGLSKAQSIVRHAFRNSMVPLMNVIVPMFTHIMGGSLVV